MNVLGERIKERRLAQNMTQAELATRIGYRDKSTIARIEKGENEIPQSKLLAFADALRTTPAYLSGWDDYPIDFAERLKSLRNRDNITVGELARKLNLPEDKISRYENRVLKPTDLEELEAISDLFSVDVMYLLGFSEENTYYELTLEEMDELAMLDPYNRTPAKKQDLGEVFAEILQNMDADEYELDNKPVSDAARVAIKTGVNTALAMARAQK